jgi:hypothetical protein
LLRGSINFLYVNEVHTSPEAQASTPCSGDSYFLYVDDIRTSQETQAFTACYRDCFTFLYVDDVRTSQEAHASTTCYRDHKEIIKREEREKGAVGIDTPGGGGTEFVIGFEGSQALTVCPSGKCKHLTGTIEV